MTWTDDEREALADMRRAGGFRSDEEVIRGALFWYASFLLDLDVPIELFAIGPSPVRHADQPDLFEAPVCD